MKLIVLECDWKEHFKSEDINKAMKEVGGDRIIYDFSQTLVDSNIMFVSSKPIKYEQMQELFDAGSLTLCVKTFKGTYKQILNEVRELNKEITNDD